MTKLIRFREYIQPDGALVPLEFHKEDLPFVPRRAFFIRNVPEDQIRGNHAHRTCHQLFVAVSGSFNVMAQRGENIENHNLSLPVVGLHVEPMTWVVANHFSPSAICMVLASHEYDLEDYINDFDEYKELAGSLQ